MFSHFTLGANNLERSLAFYGAIMPIIGCELLYTDSDAVLMYGPKEGQHPHIFIVRPFDDLPATWSNGFHIAFNVSSSAHVNRFYEMALANGGIDEGRPGIRDEYDTDYYAAYVRDPDGNKIQAVCYQNGRSHLDDDALLSHITLGYKDFTEATSFYRAIFSALEIDFIPSESDDSALAFGNSTVELPLVFIQPTFDGRPATWGNGTHCAFHATSKQMVKTFYSTALANGGTCDGAPGLREQYSPGYYSAYVRDSIGNKIQAVYRDLGAKGND